MENFLKEGEKSIVISFSSMPLKDPRKLKEKLVEAIKKTSNRGIVLTGTSGMYFRDKKNIFTIKKASHRLIFKEAKGIIHHGGVSTMSEALSSRAA